MKYIKQFKLFIESIDNIIYILSNKYKFLNKYFDKIESETNIIRLLETNPTYNPINLTKLSLPITDFIFRLYIDGEIDLIDLESIKLYLDTYLKYSNSIKGLDFKKIRFNDLYESIKKYIITVQSPISKRIELLDDSEYQILYKDDKYTVYNPITEKASSIIGSGTNWCNTWGVYSLDRISKYRTSQFNEYNDGTDILMIIDNITDLPKYQFYYSITRKLRFNDNHDNNLNIIETLKKDKGIFNFLITYIESYFNTLDKYHKCYLIKDLHNLCYDRLLNSSSIKNFVS